MVWPGTQDQQGGSVRRVDQTTGHGTLDELPVDVDVGQAEERVFDALLERLQFVTTCVLVVPWW